MFNFIKKSLQKIYSSCSQAINSLFSRPLDDHTLGQLEKILLSADVGVKTTKRIINQLELDIKLGTISKNSDLKKELEQLLIKELNSLPSPLDSKVYLLVGINGSGKTTFASKLAYYLQKKEEKILLVAADTFRAAAPEQLAQWAHILDIECIQGTIGQDPTSVIYQACDRFKQNNYDALIIDTAGRLQTKTNLMNELAKIRRTITKQLGQEIRVTTLLTIDAMLGQNSFEQARIFQEATQVSGIVLTKMDGTGKGGIVFSITNELKIPIKFISYGEKPEQLIEFDPQRYIAELLG